VDIRWKLFVSLVAIVIGIGSAVGIHQAGDDITAREKLEQEVIRDAQIEAARKERIKQINRVNHDQCAALQNLYATIRNVIKEGDSLIDTSDYYRTRPSEREAAHERNQKIIRQFRTPPCPPDISIEG
jgi:hypothetical protein